MTPLHHLPVVVCACACCAPPHHQASASGGGGGGSPVADGSATPAWGSAGTRAKGDTDCCIAVCTVDGQQIVCGNKGIRFPLMETVMPLMYAVALKDCGNDDTAEVRHSPPLPPLLGRAFVSGASSSSFCVWAVEANVIFYGVCVCYLSFSVGGLRANC